MSPFDIHEPKLTSSLPGNGFASNGYYISVIGYGKHGDPFELITGMTL
ncbi:hypothetical protein [Metallosphaera hakonensis]|nr:hypothetical protein [Metallosphaera hakonensis]